MCGKCEGNEERGEDSVLLGVGGAVRPLVVDFGMCGTFFFMCSGVLVFFLNVFCVLLDDLGCFGMFCFFTSRK